MNAHVACRSPTAPQVARIVLLVSRPQHERDLRRCGGDQSESAQRKQGGHTDSSIG